VTDEPTDPPKDDPPAPSASTTPASAIITSETASTASGSVIIDDDTLLATTGSDAELRAAAGVDVAKLSATAPRKLDDHDDHDDHHTPPHRRSRAVFAAGVFLIGSLAIGALVLLGHVNAGRYEVACAPDEIRAEHGRAFPPWGAREMQGAEWKAIAIPADAECTAQDFDSEDALGTAFVALIVERADKALLARDPLQAEVASALLQQALLLARAPSERDQRKVIERMLGDVDYWRATGKLAAARQQLVEAAKQFETASAQVPRHVTDAAAWSAFVHHVVDDLQAGPGSAVAPHVGSAATVVAPPSEHPAVPVGVALPIEPPPSGTALPMPALDAGVPAGGVLM
jgi:hypothetical protein